MSQISYVFETSDGQVLVTVSTVGSVFMPEVDVAWRSGPDDVWGPPLEPVEVSSS